MCLSVDKISQKVLKQSTSFLVGAFPVIQGGNHSPRGKGGSGGGGVGILAEF